MQPKEKILEAYKLNPKQYSLMASSYFMLTPDMQEKFKRVTNDLSENAADITQDEARFISSMDLDMKRSGQLPFLTPKAKKRLMEIL
jgi:hypothetical protein